MVDEYDESEFELPIDLSVEPFSLQELIEFIDEVGFSGSIGIATCHNESNAEHMDREELADFTTVNSGIYHELESHYDQVFAQWVNAEVEEEKESTQMNKITSSGSESIKQKISGGIVNIIKPPAGTIGTRLCSVFTHRWL